MTEDVSKSPGIDLGEFALLMPALCEVASIISLPFLGYFYLYQSIVSLESALATSRLGTDDEEGALDGHELDAIQACLVMARLSEMLRLDRSPRATSSGDERTRFRLGRERRHRRLAPERIDDDVVAATGRLVQLGHKTPPYAICRRSADTKHQDTLAPEVRPAR